MKKCFLIAGLLLLPILGAQAVNGVYVTVEGGYGNLDGLPSQEAANAVNLDNNNVGYRGALGYNHDFFTHFGIGLEAALGKYGDSVYTYADGSSNTIKSSTSEFLAVLSYHVIPQLDFFLKGGEVRNRMEVYGINAPGPGAKIQPELAITGAYNFNRHLAATLTYGKIFGTEVDEIHHIGGEAPSVNMALLGLRYTFAASK